MLAAWLAASSIVTSHAAEPSPLIVSQDHAWPPFAFEDVQGRPHGVLIDLWQRIGEELGQPVEFRLVDWPATIEQLRQGEADVHGGLLESTERSRFLAFSDPILPLSTLLFVRTGAPITRIEELDATVVGVTAGSFELEFMESRHPGVHLRPFRNNEVMVQAAVTGEIQAFVADYPVAMYLLDRHAAPESFHPVERLYESPLRVAVLRENSAQLEAINAALASIDEQELRRITQRWMRSETIETLPQWLVPVLITLVVLGLLGYSLLLLRQRRQLATRVRARTAELEDERELFRALSDNAAAGIFILRDDRFIAVNPTMARIIGVSEAELRSRPFYEFVHPEFRAMVAQRARDRLAGKEVPSHYEMKVLTANGETRWIELSAERAHLRDGPATIGTLYDLTERKGLEEQLRTNETKYRNLVEHVNDIIYTLTPDGILDYVSPNWTEILGHPVDQVLGRPIVSFLHPDDVPACQGFQQQVFAAAQKDTGVEYRIRDYNGEWRWHTTNGAPVIDEAGRVTAFVGIARDITARHQLEDELQFRARFNELLARLSSDFVVADVDTIDSVIDNALTAIGEFFAVDRCYLFHLDDDGNTMRNTHEWCAPGVLSVIRDSQNVDLTAFPWWQQQMRAMLGEQRNLVIPDVEALPESAATERERLRQEGVQSMYCVPVSNGIRVTGFLGFDSLRRREWRGDQADLLTVLGNLFSEALQKNLLEQRLRELSLTDSLTGLHNRRYLMQRLQELGEEYRRHGRDFALAMIDIDFFKQLNDSHGHLAGDHILREFAELLRQEHRAFDLVARFGGEEFVVVLLDASREEAVAAMERLLESVRRAHFAYEGQPLPFTVSVGIARSAEFAPGELTPDRIINLADERLYGAKEGGRDRLVSQEQPAA
ncbi:MAG: diguanylate cyclase [Pseudomonadota bacterium]